MKKALVGYGGHAREVMAQMDQYLPCFVDDAYANDKCFPLSSFDPREFEVMIAIGNSSDRSKVFYNLPPETKFFTWIHPTALVMRNVEIGNGSFIGAHSILTDNIKIGNHAVLNRGVHIGHDCLVGDFFSAMPSSIIGGDVLIGDRVYLGSGSNIREKIKIGNDVVVGMSSGVVKNILDPGVYAGVPSKKIK